MSKYHFNGDTFYCFADLCNAFYKIMGYYPIRATYESPDRKELIFDLVNENPVGAA